MTYYMLADAVVLFHAAFVCFVIGGGFVALKWRWLVWAHLPAVVWGVLIEYTGWLCPLTPIENGLRARAGVSGYSGGFIDHYLLSRLYPGGLTPRTQQALGSLALIINLVAYSLIIVRSRREHRPDATSGP